MAELRLGTSQAQAELNKLTTSIRQTGRELDALELSKNLTTGFTSLNSAIDQAEKKAKNAGLSVDRLESSFNTLRFTGESAITGIIAAQQKAQVQLRAYTDQNNVLNKVMRDTDSMNVQISANRTLNTLREKAIADTAIHAGRQENLTTVEGRAAASSKLYTHSLERQITAGTRLTITLAEQAQELQRLNSIDAQAAERNKILLRAKEQLVTAEARQYAELMKLRNAKELDNTSTARQINQLKEEAAVRARASASQKEEQEYYRKKTDSVRKLRRELEYLKTAEAKEAALLQQRVTDERRALASSTEATIKKRRQVNLGNQATAAMRASLAGLQTSFGMYTSSTILAASGTYALMRAIRSTITVGAEFQASMARTEAIMGGSLPRAARTDVFSAMEDQIRSLGKSTQFTATEVAEAMTELGQAGLGAGDAMLALSPTLDLSIIGQLDMARAADHVTNIMMIFGKEASDLTDIVDVLAIAVTNSNTNIDQLANALTYAGPAAETAGFSFKDTVASLEALANAGFKSNRSGTALRRLFVSLANPTEKAKNVLDQMRVSVTDLEGETYSLSTIIEQLSYSMSELGDAEKLAAIQDLVGVYAASPIAALIQQADTLKHLRYQLNETGGAADDMRRQIEAALKFDFKTALSAFQEAQLAVFSKLEDRLQNIVMSAAEWLSELTQPVEEGSIVTHLDNWIHRAEALVSIGKTLFITWSTVKLAPHVMSMVRPLEIAADRTSKLSLALQESSLKAQANSVALRGTSSAAALVSASTARATADIALFTRGLSTASVWLANATSLLARGLGLVPWIGIAYTAYEVFNMFFGSASEDRIKSQKEKVDELARSYLDTKRNIEAMAAADAKASTGKQITALQGSLNLARKERDEWVALRADMLARGLPTGYADTEISAAERQMDELSKNIRNLQNQNRSADIERLSNLERIQKVLRGIQGIEAYELEFGAEIGRSLEDTSERIRVRTEASWERINRIMQEGTSSARALEEISKLSDTTISEARLQAEEAARLKQMTALEKYLELEEQLKAKAKERVDLLKSLEGSSIVAGDDMEVTKVTQELADLIIKVGEAKLGLDDFAASAADSLEQLEWLYMSEDEKQAKLENDLAELIRLRAANIQMMLAEKDASRDSVEFQASQAEFMKEYLRLNTQLEGLRNRGGTARHSGPSEADREAAQALRDALSTYESLRQKYDQVGVAAERLAKSEEQLGLLLKRNEITTEDYSKALQQLRDDHLAVEAAANSHAAAAKRISEAYLDNSIRKTIMDLAELDEAYRSGQSGMSQEVYQRTRGRVLESGRPTDLPSVEMPSTNATGPFGDFLNAAVTQSTDLQRFDSASEQYTSDYLDGVALARQQMEAELALLEERQLGEIEHGEEMARIQATYHSQWTSGAEKYAADQASIADQRVEYEKQSNMLVLASMAGSMSQMLGMIADASEDATAVQKVAFVAQQALAVAEIIMNTHLAAAKVKGQTGIFGIGLDTMIMAQGYASAGLVGSLALGQMTGGGSSDYAGAYDKGGYIPTGKYGIVGEYGPEIVNGPAHVTGREETARRMNKGGDGPQSVTIENHFNIEYTSEGSSNPEQDGRALGNVIKAVVIDTIQDQLRPNGLLHKRT